MFTSTRRRLYDIVGVSITILWAIWGIFFALYIFATYISENQWYSIPGYITVSYIVAVSTYSVHRIVDYVSSKIVGE